MRRWRGNKLPGGPCSEGMMGTGKAKGSATAKFAGGALVSTNRFDGSAATIVAVPDVGCEWIQQCGHDSMGRSKAIRSLEYSAVACFGEFSVTRLVLDSGGASTSISISA